MIRKLALSLLFALAASLAPFAAYAQSTAQPVQAGILTTTSCPGGQSPCFKQGIGGADTSPSVTPTVQNAAYSASNAIGGLQTVSVFRSTAQPSAILTNFWLGSQSGQTAGVTVYIFDANPTASTCTDKTAFSLASADFSKLAVAPFALTPATTQGMTQTIAQQALTTSVSNHDSTASTNLYVCLVANGSVTPGSTSDYVFKMSLAQD